MFDSKLDFRAFTALSLVVFAVSACSSGTTLGESAPGSPESALGSNEVQASDAIAAGIVTLGKPYTTGVCATGTATMLSTDGVGATVIFSNQTYSGDPKDPDFWEHRSEGRLIGADSKTNAPKCSLHIPMTVVAGYRFSPTNVMIRGFAHRGNIYGEYNWDKLPGYSFEKQVPLNEPADSGGDDFFVQDPLQKLWSPTCSTTANKEIKTELVALIAPYTGKGGEKSPIAIDSFDVIGKGAIEKCNSKPVDDPVAQTGEHCGTVDGDHEHYVRCDTSKQVNICVLPITDQETGTCVNSSNPPAQAAREVGLDDDCGGPFFQYCSTSSQPLVCRFISADARQNASSHYGRCSERLAVGSSCDAKFYGACNGNSCNDTLDPCVAGSKCTGGKCVGKANSASAESGVDRQIDERQSEESAD